VRPTSVQNNGTCSASSGQSYIESHRTGKSLESSWCTSNSKPIVALASVSPVTKRFVPKLHSRILLRPGVMAKGLKHLTMALPKEEGKGHDDAYGIAVENYQSDGVSNAYQECQYDQVYPQSLDM